jgi:hypothetical protein
MTKIAKKMNKNMKGPEEGEGDDSKKGGDGKRRKK